jgi:bacillopeptidase F
MHTLLELRRAGLILWCAFSGCAQAPANEAAGLGMPGGSDEPIPVIVRLADPVDVGAIADVDRHVRRGKIVHAMQTRAGQTQPALTTWLRDHGATRIHSLWIVNGVAATVTPAVARALADFPGVVEVTRDALARAPITVAGAAATTAWNLTAIDAPSLWALGLDGGGAVVASMDTGVDLSHSDLGPRWRGGTDSWWDPYLGSTVPYDAVGHGTETMGIMVGGGDSGTAIGVAPGARWIAAKIFDDQGNTSVSVIHRAFQWLLLPSGVAGAPDAPDVVNASWGLPTVNACDATFRGDLEALRAAGIVVVFAAGNSGPGPSSSVSPANNDGGFAAGAVDQGRAIASFSSRGPSACSGGIFPDLVAPGVNVETASISLGGVDQYTTVSGTSFAAPHVAGAAALLRGAFPGAAVADIEQALRATALDLGPPGADDDYGYGLVDAHAAWAAMATRASLAILTRTLPDGVAGVAYDQPLRATGGVPPLGWSLTSGALPAGLQLDGASGAIRGTPAGGGSSFTVTVVDATGATATQPFALAVVTTCGGQR